MMERPKPLDEIRALEIATLSAAPFATASVGEPRAKAVGIEPPRSDHPLRTLDPPREIGETCWWFSDARHPSMRVPGPRMGALRAAHEEHEALRTDGVV
jgi:crotonobetainyl-CoA:carnitine CoA-transferase CaiB-like acyl-CoA transferase